MTDKKQSILIIDNPIIRNVALYYPDIKGLWRLGQDSKIDDGLVRTTPSQVVDDLKLKAGNDMLLDVKDSTILVRRKIR